MSDLIAQRFAQRRFTFHYVRGKLRTDPLYPAVSAVLAASPRPLLDVGCGLGLLAHTLRAAGHAAPYLGVDHDAGKIAAAGAAAATLPHVTFAPLDVGGGLPPHSGDVALLDVLQYLPPDGQAALLESCIRRLAPDGLLVVRTGLRDRSWRYRLTHASDALGRLCFWMKCGRIHHPARDEVEAALPGLALDWQPLHAGTPFNNHFLVARRA